MHSHGACLQGPGKRPPTRAAAWVVSAVGPSCLQARRGMSYGQVPCGGMCGGGPSIGRKKCRDPRCIAERDSQQEDQSERNVNGTHCFGGRGVPRQIGRAERFSGQKEKHPQMHFLIHQHRRSRETMETPSRAQLSRLHRAPATGGAEPFYLSLVRHTVRVIPEPSPPNRCVGTF